MPRLLRFFLLLALAAIVAGCARPAPAPGSHGVPRLSVESRVIGRSARYVEVEAAHQSFDDRIERIVLVGPDGEEVSSDDVRREEIDASTGRPYHGHLHVGSGWGRPHVGIGIAIPIVIGRPRYSRQVFRTRATFEVPDPEDYRENPERWRVRLHMRNRERGAFVINEPAPLPSR